MVSTHQRQYPIEGFVEGSATFIASFGSGQVHANGYCIILADNSDAAYEWMSKRYAQKWASLYGEIKGSECVATWGWHLVCRADIRSGEEQLIEPINELIIPPDTSFVGQVQPIFETPGRIRIYNHYGISLEDKFADALKMVAICEETPKRITGVYVDPQAYSSYTELYYGE